MLGTAHAAAAAVVAATLALTWAVPANADVRRFIDARNDTSSSVDILSVRVDKSTSTRNKVIVVVRQDNVRIGDSIYCAGTPRTCLGLGRTWGLWPPPVGRTGVLGPVSQWVRGRSLNT